MAANATAKRVYRSGRTLKDGVTSNSGRRVEIVLTVDIESTFALEQLRAVVEARSKARFTLWVMSVFGSDLPIAACEALYDGVGDLENPPIDVVPAAELKGHLAAYDTVERRILISAELEQESRETAHGSAKLLIALVEEFGHHVDTLLRHDFSSIGGDSDWDEGAAFAHALVVADFAGTDRIAYGTATIGGRKRDLEVVYEELHAAAKKYLDEEAIADDDKSEGREYFGAGEPKGDHRHTFTHMTIEQRAFGRMTRADAFTKDEIPRIYFGNWTRDFSQLVDPKITEPKGESGIFAFKRSTLTAVVNVLGELQFGNHPHFKVTEDNLGVYRPEEHIDNPRGITDSSAIDKDFRGQWTPAEIAVNQTTGMKKHIAEEGKGWATSTAYIKQEIRAALSAGRKPKGLRHFGNALHTLEDYFAHSNFCEVALREAGHAKVDPWVPIPSGGRIPITTGVFGGLDTAGTILLEIGEMLQEFDPFDPGKRPATTKIFIILLRDEHPKLAKDYEWFVSEIETFKREHPLIWWMLYNTVGQVVAALKWGIGGALRGVGNAIDEYQTAVDKNSTDPTHSQLAKDHLDHHFHELASLLAIEAVQQVGDRMIDAWSGKSSPGSGANPADSFEWHKVKTGESLDSLARDAGITWQELAQYNWGTAVPAQINIHLRDDVGCTKTTPGGNYIFTDSASPGRIKIPVVKDARPPDVAEFAAGFLVHPADATWGWRKIVLDWAKAHPAQLKRAESRAWYDHELKEWKRAVDKLTGGAGAKVEELWNHFL